MAKIIQNSTGVLLYHFYSENGFPQEADYIELKIIDPDGMILGENLNPTYLGQGTYQFILPITYTAKEGRHSAAWNVKKYQTEIVDIEYFDVVKVEEEYICTVKDVKEFMGITDTIQDELIRQLIFAFQGIVEGYCKRKFKPTVAFEEKYNGDNSRILVLNHYPIIDISKVEIVNEQVIPKRNIGAGITEGFICDFASGIISLTPGYIFTEGIENILITYVYGYDEPLFDLKMAGLEWISFKLKYKDSLGIESESLGPYRISYDKAYLPENVRGILDNYARRFGI